MKITHFLSDLQILTELGERIKTARVRTQWTQAELAKNSGVAKSTVERVEKGESIQFLNIIKIMRALNTLNTLDIMLPSTEKTPFEYLKEATTKKRYRVYKIENEKEIMVAEKPKPFKWGDDQ